jgi:hypothetical protein
MTDEERERFQMRRSERADEHAAKRRKRAPARKARPLPPVTKPSTS